MSTANPSLIYSTTTNIRMSLEDYHNAGLTPEETKNIIESVRSPTGGMLWCKPVGINGNWYVEVWTKNHDVIYDLVEEIHCALTYELNCKKKLTTAA